MAWPGDWDVRELVLVDEAGNVLRLNTTMLQTWDMDTRFDLSNEKNLTYLGDDIFHYAEHVYVDVEYYDDEGDEYG